MPAKKKNKISFDVEIKEVKMVKNKDNDKEYSCKFFAFTRELMALEGVPEDQPVKTTMEW